MKYLIDGHNLIHALPGIDLADEHDEAKLVLKLRGFFGRINKKAEVFFDHGLPGGVNHTLSTPQVKVTFAPAFHSDADTLIKGRIQRHGDPAQLIVVSSDHAVLNAAAARGIPTLTSQAFVAQLAQTMAPAADSQENHEKPADPEVDYWLNQFKRRNA